MAATRLPKGGSVTLDGIGVCALTHRMTVAHFSMLAPYQREYRDGTPCHHRDYVVDDSPIPAIKLEDRKCATYSLCYACYWGR